MSRSLTPLQKMRARSESIILMPDGKVVRRVVRNVQHHPYIVVDNHTVWVTRLQTDEQTRSGLPIEWAARSRR